MKWAAVITVEVVAHGSVIMSSLNLLLNLVYTILSVQFVKFSMVQQKASLLNLFPYPQYCISFLTVSLNMQQLILISKCFFFNFIT